MEPARHGTNTALLVDTFKFSPKPYQKKPEILRDLYLREGLSASQIAARLGWSKSTVLERLRAMGIAHGDPRLNDPKNYRLFDAPYGFTVRDGQLVPDAREMRVCRLVVELRGRKGKSLKAVAAELTKRGLRNRRGGRQWHHWNVGRIYRHWMGKV